MKALVPWLLAVVLLGAAAFFFSANRKLSAETAALRAESAQVEPLRAEVEQLKKTGSPVQAEEIARLRKNTEELLKLRNENRQLRDGNKELEKQAQSAQAREQAAKAQAQAAASHAETALAQVQAAQQAARAGAPGFTTTQLLNACINNLRQLDGAKQQWALENRKTAKETPPAEQLAAYLKDGFPKCPASGRYTLNAVEAAPTCSVAGHALAE